MRSSKPLSRKNYGSIPHLPGSRQGPGDHSCHDGQARIATVKTRDKHDEVIVQEKLDGSNVGVARIDGVLYPLGRAGYTAISSPHEQHRHFHNWVWRPRNYERFMAVLKDGERLVGEWLMLAHGTRYELHHEPFVAFDLMREDERVPFEMFLARIEVSEFITPAVLSRGVAYTVGNALMVLGKHGGNGYHYGYHGALEPVEGAVWRVERDKLIDRHSGKRRRVVDFLVKYVRPDKVDGKYFEGEPVWNWRP